jgi:flagellar protein FlaI
MNGGGKLPKAKVYIPTLTKEESQVANNIISYIEQKIKNQFINKNRPERFNIVKNILAEEFGELDEKVLEKVLVETAGYGIIDSLVMDDNLEEIMINGVNTPIFVVSRKYGMCETNVVIPSIEYLNKLIDRIQKFTGKKIDPKYPILDAALPEGCRVNVTLPPCAFLYPVVTIRKFKVNPISIIDLINNNTLTSEVAGFLWLCVDGYGIRPMNIIIAGGTGSGKTTFFNSLLVFSSQKERIITIEDTLELNLSYHKNWIRLETAIIEKNEITMQNLLKNSLRMRPDRICVGEVRGPEANDLMVAMDIGLTAMGTIHANSSKEVFLRLKSPPMNVPIGLMHLLDIIIILKRFYHRGKQIRRVVEVTEVSSHREGDQVLTSTSFQWDPEQNLLVMKSLPVETRDTLAREAGIDVKDIQDEISIRSTILEWMRAKNIRSQDRIAEIIQLYYANPKAFLKKIEYEWSGALRRKISAHT